MPNQLVPFCDRTRRGLNTERYRTGRRKKGPIAKRARCVMQCTHSGWHKSPFRTANLHVYIRARFPTLTLSSPNSSTPQPNTHRQTSPSEHRQNSPSELTAYRTPTFSNYSPTSTHRRNGSHCRHLHYRRRLGSRRLDQRRMCRCRVASRRLDQRRMCRCRLGSWRLDQRRVRHRRLRPRRLDQRRVCHRWLCPRRLDFRRLRHCLKRRHITPSSRPALN